ncbi:PBCV-specific basic adaptor domain-containing protein [Paramecium bursaria Chlorella virus NW665.2]|nr:PBCV-specific basic adaptor domain-containing protein [Paramecium bursaria Chlorella virus NW665.2]
MDDKKSLYKLWMDEEIDEKTHNYVKNAVNLKPKGFYDVNIKALTSSNPFILPSDAKKLGEGAYGTVYQVVNTNKMKENLMSSLKTSTGKIVSSVPDIGTELIIKVAQQKNMSTAKFLDDSLRENLVHKHFTESPSCSLVSRAKPVCVSEYVPKFYMSFITKNSKEYETITVMNRAGYTTLATILMGTKLSQTELVHLYVEIERAICSLWLAGYVHADLHKSNIMVTKEGKNPKIIDFGFSIVLPDSFRKQIASYISGILSSGSNRSLAEVWMEVKMNGGKTIKEYSNTIILKRGFEEYSSETTMLKELWNKIRKSNRKLISKIRSVEWGVQDYPKVTPPLVAKSPVISTGKKDTGNIDTGKKAMGNINTGKKDMGNINTGKIDAKKRRVFKDSKGRTYVKDAATAKKIYVKKLFTPKANPLGAGTTSPTKSPMVDTGKIDAKKRRVFKDSKGRTYVKDAATAKKIYVKKLFTPKANPLGTGPSSVAKSPMVNTGKIDAKKRRVFKDSKGRTYVKDAATAKKIYVKKLFTPK